MTKEHYQWTLMLSGLLALTVLMNIFGYYRNVSTARDLQQTPRKIYELQQAEKVLNTLNDKLRHTAPKDAAIAKLLARYQPAEPAQ